MGKNARVGFGDFLIWLVLGMVTFGIYPTYWMYARLEELHRATVRDD